MENPIKFYDESKYVNNQILAMQFALMNDADRKAKKIERIEQLKMEKQSLILKSMLLTVDIERQRYNPVLIQIRDMDQSKQDNVYVRSRTPSTSDSDSGFSSCGSSSYESSYENRSSMASKKKCTCDSLVFAPKNSEAIASIKASENRFKIKVQHIGKDIRPYVINILGNYKILKIKELLWGKTATRPSLQELFFNDIQLNDDKIASDYGIVEGSILQVSVMGKKSTW